VQLVARSQTTTSFWRTTSTVTREPVAAPAHDRPQKRIFNAWRSATLTLYEDSKQMMYWLFITQIVEQFPARVASQVARNVSAHQLSMASHPRMYVIQTGIYDVSIYPRHLSVLPIVVFHPCFPHDIQTTAAIFYLSSSGSSAKNQKLSEICLCYRLLEGVYTREISLSHPALQLSVVPVSSLSVKYQTSFAVQFTLRFHSFSIRTA